MNMPQRFTKLPVTITAMQFITNNDLDHEDMNSILDWINGDNPITRHQAWHDSANIHIRTLEGTMRASIGDWIIQGVNGEFYPCKPDIFEKTYVSENA